ncbi:recombinase family protein [Nocardia sp. bgisy134]|uniref:recombinase family protein n=1 Tax=unclassified Nocardia TaxID=2637762 RepID=UPI003D74B182
MYIGYTSLRGVTCYLDGYDQAARRHGGQGLNGFREWLMANHVGESSFTWWAMVQLIALPDWDFQTDLTYEQELPLSVMGAFAEFEHALILERQREGIAAAKARGTYTGRKPALTTEQAQQRRERAAAG